MRRHHDPIDVAPAGGAAVEAPAGFCWRDRRYLVIEVLSHWVEVGVWWQPPGPRRRLRVAGVGPPGQRAGGSAGGSANGGAVDGPRQQQWWRVAARSTHPAERSRVGVYELCHAVDGWSLRRVHD